MTNTFLQDFYQNLRAGFRLMTFQRISLWDFRFSLDQLMALLCLNLLITLISDFTFALPYPKFDTYAIPVYIFDLVWPFLIAYFVEKWLSKKEAALEILIIIFSYSPLINIIFIASGFFEEDQTKNNQPPSISKNVLAIYLILLIYRAYYIVTIRNKIVTLVALIVFCVIAGLSNRYFKDYYEFWYAAEPEYEYSKEKDYYLEYRKLDAEALMYKQQAMLDKALAELKPQRKKHSDIYFVGFAPYAMQDVFHKEITYAKDLMDKRFDTKGRSINLINHLKTTDKTPLATGTNLGITLKHIGKLMDKDEDILVLYLTSHGSKEHELSINFYPLRLNDLTPAKLKTMLDEAGIKWRVVIVSACYSGGYVKPLANDNTLVASAAAADKTSFGCGNEFDFTYFGQALFKDQLDHQTSLISALKRADIEIGKREVREKKEPSNPQLSVGANIEAKLNSLEKTLTAYQCGKNYQAAAKC